MQIGKSICASKSVCAMLCLSFCLLFGNCKAVGTGEGTSTNTVVGRVIGFHFLVLDPSERSFNGTPFYLWMSPEVRTALINDLNAQGNVQLTKGNFDFQAEVTGEFGDVQHTDTSRPCYVPDGMLDARIGRCINVARIDRIF